MALKAQFRISLVYVLFMGILGAAWPVGSLAAEPKAWLGGAFGLSVPNKSDTTARPMFGVNLGAKLGSEFGIGVHYLTSSKNEDVSGRSVPWNYQLYGISGSYHFEGEAKGVYLGALLGMSRVETKYLGGDLATSPMHYGVFAGYNHPIAGEMFTLGGEASFISIGSASGSVYGISRDTEAFSTLNFLITGKFWL